MILLPALMRYYSGHRTLTRVVVDGYYFIFLLLQGWYRRLFYSSMPGQRIHAIVHKFDYWWCRAAAAIGIDNQRSQVAVAGAAVLHYDYAWRLMWRFYNDTPWLLLPTSDMTFSVYIQPTLIPTNIPWWFLLAAITRNIAASWLISLALIHILSTCKRLVVTFDSATMPTPPFFFFFFFLRLRLYRHPILSEHIRYRSILLILQLFSSLQVCRCTLYLSPGNSFSSLTSPRTHLWTMDIVLSAR